MDFLFHPIIIDILLTISSLFSFSLVIAVMLVIEYFIGAEFDDTCRNEDARVAICKFRIFRVFEEDKISCNSLLRAHIVFSNTMDAIGTIFEDAENVEVYWMELISSCAKECSTSAPVNLCDPKVGTFQPVGGRTWRDIYHRKQNTFLSAYCNVSKMRFVERKYWLTWNYLF